MLSLVCGPTERISALEVGAAAIGKMKQGKLAGLTGVVAEILKAAGETGIILWMTEIKLLSILFQINITNR